MNDLLIGRGKSKKEAKRLAAHQMWKRLQDLPVDSQDDGTDDVSKNYFTQQLIVSIKDCTASSILGFNFDVKCWSTCELSLGKNLFGYFLSSPLYLKSTCFECLPI